jgi:hypothetical protein
MSRRSRDTPVLSEASGSEPWVPEACNTEANTESIGAAENGPLTGAAARPQLLGPSQSGGDRSLTNFMV